MQISTHLCEKFKKVKLLLMDVDGILNDGRVYYVPFPKGEIKIAKFFNVRDGLGINLLRAVGIKIGVITGRSDEVVLKRCQDLKCAFIKMGVKNKLAALEEALKTFNLTAEEVCYIGDDWNDFPVLKAVGVSATVADAPEEIKEVVDYITTKKGGDGAVRELIEVILKCQNRFEEAVSIFLQKLEKGEKP